MLLDVDSFTTTVNFSSGETKAKKNTTTQTREVSSFIYGLAILYINIVRTARWKGEK